MYLGIRSRTPEKRSSVCIDSNIVISMAFHRVSEVFLFAAEVKEGKWLENQGGKVVGEPGSNDYVRWI